MEAPEAPAPEPAAPQPADMLPPSAPAAPPQPPAEPAPPAAPPERMKEPDRIRREEPAAPAKKPAPAAPSPKRFEPKKPGDVAWIYPAVGSRTPRAAIRNCPAVGEKGRIYAALGTTLYAIVEEKGVAKILWEYATDGHIPGSPSLGPDSNIRVHSADGTLHCINLDGDEVFTSEVGEPLGFASPLADDDSNTWICAYNGGLLKVDSKGEHRRQAFFRSRQKFDSTGLLYKGIYYVGSEDGFIYAISTNGMRGRITWDHLAGQGKTDWFINSALCLTPDPIIVVAGRDEHLYGFQLNGKKAWKVHLHGQLLGSPVVSADGDVYVGVSTAKAGRAKTGKLVCIGSSPHKIKWEYKAQGLVESTPVLGNDGIVYFGDNAGSIHAVDRDGNRQWLMNVGTAIRSAGTIPCPHRVVFGTDKGIMVAVQCSSDGLAEGGWPKIMGNLGQSGIPPL